MLLREQARGVGLVCLVYFVRETSGTGGKGQKRVCLAYSVYLVGLVA